MVVDCFTTIAHVTGWRKPSKNKQYRILCNTFRMEDRKGSQYAGIIHLDVGNLVVGTMVYPLDDYEACRYE
jgi:hypothetical protein